ncbi:MAG TPA: mannitol dehydrogenase family protein, partial [Rhizobiaceae bacterium]|nr:mannitol dehydrogenase family protein [Rhizobiaceae bacterium]
RLSKGLDVTFLSIATAGWMTYLIRASDRFGKAWTADDPYATRVAAIADRIGDDPAALAREILAIDTIFHPELAAHAGFKANITDAFRGLLSDDPLNTLRHVCETNGHNRLNRLIQTR